MNKYQEALDYLEENSAYEIVNDGEDCYKNITQKGVKSVNDLQELVDKEQTTCMGYKVEDLIIFANLLNYYKIDTETLHSSTESIKLGYKICQDDFKKTMQETFERIMKNE